MSTYYAHKVIPQLLSELLDVIIGKEGVARAEIREQLRAAASNQEINNRIDQSLRSGYIRRDRHGQYSVTEKGVRKLDTLKLRRVATDQPWDGKWRVITFDIPESARPLRDAIRRLIKQLGMVQLQRSVWVHRFECYDQFEAIRKAYGEQGHIVYMVVVELKGIDISGFFHDREKSQI